MDKGGEKGEEEKDHSHKGQRAVDIAWRTAARTSYQATFGVQVVVPVFGLVARQFSGLVGRGGCPRNFVPRSLSSRGEMQGRRNAPRKSVCSSHTVVGSRARHTSPALCSSLRAFQQGPSPHGVYPTALPELRFKAHPSQRVLRDTLDCYVPLASETH